MKILFLSSANPMFGHAKAGYLVLASLMEAFSQMGHSVGFATVGCPNKIDDVTKLKLQELKISSVGDFSGEIIGGKNSKFFRFISYFRQLFWSTPNDDHPHFRNPQKVVRELELSGADMYILFWDTYFELLLPYMRNVRTVGYWAKPPHDSAVVRFKHAAGLNLLNCVRNYFAQKILAQREHRHLERARKLSAVSNICAVDANYYNENGIRCTYVPNTWPDLFGKDWLSKKQKEEGESRRIEILANIGQLSATGNSFGLSFLADKILPYLDKTLKGIDWGINICGNGLLNVDLKKKMQHSRVHLKGFVPDIDKEILRNKIFLLLNNAGPFTGGYTRVMYAFSSGSCLIAHSSLAKSMPEVRHEYNALLGTTPQEIVGLIKKACNDRDLRVEIGRNARETYEEKYRPEVIANHLINLAKCVCH